MRVLNLEHIEIAVGNKEIVSDSSFVINEGDVILLTGPNGCGKSTLVKSIIGDVFDYTDLNLGNTKAIYKDKYDVLATEKESQLFRKHICYVSQEDVFESDSVMDCFLMAINYDIKTQKERYVFEFVRKYDIQECFVLGTDTKLNLKSKRMLRRAGIDEDGLDENGASAASFLSMSIKKMSGGQRKLTNIFTNLIRCEFCDLIILDEPLNNLDYNNVRAFSNALTRIYRSNPALAIVLVTHCRAIPIVNRVLEIDTKTKRINEVETSVCSSCFGEITDDGFYQ